MKSRKKPKIWLRVALITFLIILIGSSAYGYTIYQSLTTTIETMHEPIERKLSTIRIEEVTLTKKEPFSVLMLGVDERKDDRGRSDTLIVLTVNPNQNSVKMLSIPRDTRTSIIGYNIDDKINHAYAFGGIEMSMATVEKFLNIPIDYYIKINMEGFEEIVDALGGVSIINDLDFSSDGIHFPEGEITLNGKEALTFSRMRYEDPRGDFGRQLRQRQIIQAILKEGASFSSLTNFREIFKALGSNIKTNLTFDEMTDIQKNYRSAAKQVEQLSISGKGTIINEIYYLIISEEEKERIQDELRNHLEI